MRYICFACNVDWHGLGFVFGFFDCVVLGDFTVLGFDDSVFSL